MAQSSKKSTSKKRVTTKKTATKKAPSKASASGSKADNAVKAEVTTSQVDVKTTKAQAKPKTDAAKSAAKSKDTTSSNAKADKSLTASTARKETKAQDRTTAAKQSMPERSAAPVATPKSGAGIAWLALLFSLGGLAAGGYAYYLSTLNQQTTGSKVSAIDSQIASLATEQKSTSEAVSSVGDRIDQVEQSVTQQFSEVTAGLSKSTESLALLQQQATTMAKQAAPLAEQTKALEEHALQLQTKSTESMNALSDAFGVTAQKWHQQELASVLDSVERNLAWSGNPVQAIDGLSLLGEQLDEVKYAPVIAQLNDALAALKGVPVLDLDKPYSQLKALSDQVVNLPFMQDTALRAQQPKSASIDSAQVENEAAETASFKDIGKKLFADLGDLVKIQNIDKTPSAKLDSNAKFLVNESMRLNLKAAQLALLGKNDNLFKSELGAALAAAEQHFDLNAAEVIQWSKEVEGLASLTLKTNVPDISGLKTAFDKVVAGE